jgi:hypothetical protein
LALRRNGASVGTAIAFTLGNPTFNPAVLVWIALVLGFQWAGLRLVLGLALVIGAVVIASRMTAGTEVDLPQVEAAVEAPPQQGPWFIRWLRSLIRFTLILVPLMVILVVALGAARAFLFPAIGAEWGNSAVAILGFALAGMAFAIPTGAEVPIVQTMMGYGLGAGPAGALLLTLAPLSAASLAMLAHGFPVRVLVALGGLTVFTGIVAGTVAVALGL